MFSYWLSDRGYILRSDALGVPGTEVSNADVGAASECHLVTTAQLRLVVKQTILGERRSENDKRWWSECDILTGVAMWADCGPAAKYWLPVYVYWRMQWLQLSEGGSRSWTEKKGNTHCYHLTNATILTVKYSSLFLKSPLPSCWSRDSVQAYSFQPPALWWSSTSSLCRLKHSGSGELWMSLCGHRAKVRNPWDIVSGRYRFIHVCNTPHHIHTVLQNTERHLNSLTHFVASREGSRREPKFFGKS